MPKAQKEVPTICFNYFRDEELINIKFRAKDKDFKLAKDAELIFYNLDALKDVRECVIVEGEIDCLSYYESGIYNVVSVPNGAAKGSQKLQYLDNCWEYFDKLEKIIISVDNDYPGELLKEELCRRLGKEKCYTVQYPEGCKDANEVLVKYGKEAVKSLTENAKLYPLEGEITVDIMSDTVFEYYKNGYPEGVAAGIPGFDEYLTFVPGQLTMVTGIPGSGKDEFVNRIIVGLAENAGWKTGIIGFEEPSEITVTKLIEKRGRKSFGYRKDPTQRLSTREFEEGLLFVDDYFKFMNADEMDITMDGIIEKAIQMVKRYGINCLVISPYNCIEHKIPRGYSETQYVSEILGKLISFLRKHQVHCFFIAHPTKIQKDKSSGEYEIPTLYNISGSANFFNKTHNGISIYRYFETNVVKVYIQKIKWSWLGKLGSCSFNYNTITRQYEAINSNGTIKHKPLSGSLENGHSVLPPERDSIPENSDELPF
jgi:twinkle protein